MAYENIRLSFPSGKFTLKGILSIPSHILNPPIIIGSHGLFGSSNSKKQIIMAKHCNSLGLAFLRFDHRGCGKSDGVFLEDTSFKGRCCDIFGALKKINHIKTFSKVGFFGNSLGGSITLYIASILKKIPLVICAAPIQSSHIKKKAIIKYTLGKNTNVIKQENLINDSFNKLKVKLYFNLNEKISLLSNVLIFHGTSDKTVPVSDAFEIFNKLKKDSKLILYKKGNHQLNQQEYQKDLMEKAGNWYCNKLIFNK